ncbi:uncharacterized protein Tco025E_10254, partial [Trypanosoma conorhini]
SSAPRRCYYRRPAGPTSAVGPLPPLRRGPCSPRVTRAKLCVRKVVALVPPSPSPSRPAAACETETPRARRWGREPRAARRLLPDCATSAPPPQRPPLLRRAPAAKRRQKGAAKGVCGASPAPRTVHTLRDGGPRGVNGQPPGGSRRGPQPHAHAHAPHPAHLQNARNDELIAASAKTPNAGNAPPPRHWQNAA